MAATGAIIVDVRDEESLKKAGRHVEEFTCLPRTMSGPKHSSKYGLAAIAPWQVWLHSRCERLFGSVPQDYPFRKRVAVALHSSPAGYTWDVAQTILSVVACLVYVLSTYDVAVPSSLDLWFTHLFAVDYLLRGYAAESRLTYPLGMHAIVDLFTVVPVYVEWATQHQIAALTFLRFIRVLRIMRILRAFKILNNSMSAVHRQLLSLCLTVTSIMFLSAGLVHVVEGELGGNSDFTFGTALYFVVVTMSTVGYGDISPQTTLGRWIVAAMIVVSFIAIPIQINKLTNLLSQASKFRKRVKVHEVPHALVVGAVANKLVLREFAFEMLHPDRLDAVPTAARKRQLVVMNPEKPGDFMAQMMNKPELQKKLRYFQGSIMRDEDLFKASADAADACFVLSDPEAHNAEEEDKHTILRTLTLLNFNPALQVYVHLLGAQHKALLKEARPANVVCLDELSMQMMAQSCMALGFSTLINNLLRCSMHTHVASPQPWQQEYRHGAAVGMHTMPVPDEFVGRCFTEVAAAVYRHSEGKAICWGIMTGENDGGDVLLCPGEQYRVSSGDELCMTAGSKHVVDLLEAGKYSPYFEGRADDWEGWEGMDTAAARAQCRQLLPSSDGCSLEELREICVEEVTCSGHIVVAGGTRHAHLLLQALASQPCLPGCDEAPHVVIVTNRPLQELTSINLAQLCVSIVQGDINRLATLHRANLANARCCALLPSTGGAAEVEGEMLDTELLFTYLVLQKFISTQAQAPGRAPAFIIANLSSVSSVRALDSSVRAIGCEAAASRDQRSMSVGTGCGQATGDSHSARDARQQRAARRKLHTTQLRQEARRTFSRGGDTGANLPFYAGGHGFASSSLHTYLCQAFYNPKVTRVAKAVLRPTPGSGVLTREEVPPMMIGWTFAEVFTDILERRGSVAVALYRRRDRAAGHCGYVYTAPASTSKVAPGDALILLVPSPLQVVSVPAKRVQQMQHECNIRNAETSREEQK